MGEPEAGQKRRVPEPKRQTEINEELAKPYIASDYKKACELSEKAAEKRQQIDELYKKWEAAEERLAELTSADD